ncbi:unnamed protein product [Eretmochelys imbricata]
MHCGTKPSPPLSGVQTQGHTCSKALWDSGDASPESSLRKGLLGSLQCIVGQSLSQAPLGLGSGKGRIETCDSLCCLQPPSPGPSPCPPLPALANMSLSPLTLTWGSSGGRERGDGTQASGMGVPPAPSGNKGMGPRRPGRQCPQPHQGATGWDPGIWSVSAPRIPHPPVQA